MKVKDICLPLKSYLVADRDASVPKIVAKVHDEMATIKEFFKASCNVSWYKRVSNHWSEKPVKGKAIIWLLLNEKIGKSKAGAYKNNRYVYAKIFKYFEDFDILISPQIFSIK